MIDVGVDAIFLIRAFGFQWDPCIGLVVLAGHAFTVQRAVIWLFVCYSFGCVSVADLGRGAVSAGGSIVGRPLAACKTCMW